jgi:hypothetical protein
VEEYQTLRAIAGGLQPELYGMERVREIGRRSFSWGRERVEKREIKDLP